MLNFYMGLIIQKKGSLYEVSTKNGKFIGEAKSVVGARTLVIDYWLLCYEKGYDVPEVYLQAIRKIGG